MPRKSYRVVGSHAVNGIAPGELITKFADSGQRDRLLARGAIKEVDPEGRPEGERK